MKLLNKKVIVIAIFCVLLPILLEFTYFGNKTFDISTKMIIRIFVEYGILSLILIFYILNKYSKRVEACVNFIFKYRYLIGLIIFIFMVVFKLNFSSIGMWAEVIPSDENQGTTLIGTHRSVRSDEWLVQTAFFLAQTKSSEFYPLENSNIRYDGQNMLMVYPSPVFDLTLIAKPMNWGFFIFGADRGLAWYWSMTTILIVLFAIEFVNILTKSNKLLSLVGGFMLAFSPAIMWWYSSTGMIYLSAFAIMIAFYYYMNNLEFKLWKKILLAIGLLMAVTCFALCFYPTLQIPVAYIIVAFCLIEFIKNFKKIKGKDWIIIVVTILAIIIVLGYYLVVSFDDIKAMMSTKYPGARNELGGDFGVEKLVDYCFGIFTPFYDSFDSNFGNDCEVAAFIYPITGLFVVIIAFFIKGIKKGSIKENIKNMIKNNWFITALIAIYIFEFIYIFIGFNNIIAKISLFFMSKPNRMLLTLGLTGSILVILLLNKLINRDKVLFDKKTAICISLISCFLAIVGINLMGYAHYFGKLKLLVLLPMIFSMTYFFVTANKKGFCYLMFIVTMVAGVSINPITYSTDAIYKTNTSKKIQEIVSNDENAIWIGSQRIEAQYAIANGARVLNGVNYYPNFTWIEMLDPDGKYDEVYNRYAHIEISLSNATKFDLLCQDTYKLTLTSQDLQKLGIKYYLTSEFLSEDDLEKYNMDLIFNDEKEGKNIYYIK